MTTLSELYRDHPNHSMRKFFVEQQSWMAIARHIASGLGLDRPPSGLRILDVGCGVGQFVRVCNDFGHRAVGVDLSDPVLEQAASLYGVRYRSLAIEAGKSLPEDLCDFDLITAFGVNLRLADGDYWTWREWEPLLADMLSRIVAGGRLVLRPNLGPGPNIVLEVDRWKSIVDPTAIEARGGQLTVTKTEA